MKDRNDRIVFEITRHLGTVNTSHRGWKKELNIVAWNGADAKYDLRDWDENHNHMSRGITLTEDEAKKLYEILKKEFEG